MGYYTKKTLLELRIDMYRNLYKKYYKTKEFNDELNKFINFESIIKSNSSFCEITIPIARILEILVLRKSLNEKNKIDYKIFYRFEKELEYLENIENHWSWEYGFSGKQSFIHSESIQEMKDFIKKQRERQIRTNPELYFKICKSCANPCNNTEVIIPSIRGYWSYFCSKECSKEYLRGDFYEI